MSVLAPVLAAVVAGLFATGTTLIAARRAAKTAAADEASKVIRDHRDPLLRAAYELQSRIYNIIVRDFLARHASNAPDGGDRARLSTAWLYGQYLGQVELLRRKLQFLDLGSRRTNQELQGRLNDVATSMGSDLARTTSDLMVISRSEQRAIGEYMLVTRTSADGPQDDLKGYQEFTAGISAVRRPKGDGCSSLSVVRSSRRERAESPFTAWLERFAGDMVTALRQKDLWATAPRLTDTQRSLIAH
jgi:hypothetical protein